MSSETPLNRIYLSVFLVSVSVIAYQILLIKLYSINYWYHFAYLIISMAMLGFGVSGTFIALFKRFSIHNTSAILFYSPLVAFFTVWLNLYLSRIIEFNPIMIVWDRKEAIKLTMLSFSLFMPFFFAALTIGLSFFQYTKEIHKLYFFNMIGSGLGSLIILLGFLHMRPYEMLSLVSVFLICAGLCIPGVGKRKVLAVSCLVLMVPFYGFLIRGMPVEMSDFKDQKQMEKMRGSGKELEIFGAMGLLTVIDGSAIHFMPDLSLKSDHVLPRQKAMFIDGNIVGPITSYGGNRSKLDFMDWRSSSLSYQLLKNPDVLVLGAGTGTEILNAYYHEAKSISVIEINPDIVNTLKGYYGKFSGNVYALPYLKVLIDEGRGYLENTAASYDLIQISLLDSMTSSAGGMYSISENYLLTKEAMISCLKRLKPQGILSISSWVRNPPRDVIKLMATVIEAMENIKQHAPAMSLVVIRSWQTATILVKNGEYNSVQIEAVKDYCRERLFDIVYYPGVKRSETNIYNELENDYFYTAAIQLLSPEREIFYDNFPFYIKPASDNMPYFSHFFKIDLLKQYIYSSNQSIIPFMDWNYILVWMSLVVMAVFGFIFIVAPICIVKRKYKKTASVFAYFGGLGLAYMLMEISILQQFMLYLHHPIYSVSLVVGSFLFYSGIGSWLAAARKEVRNKETFIFVVILIAAGIVIITSTAWLPHAIAGASLPARLLVCSLLIAPLALIMGMPFPSGLSILSQKMKDMIPWAWGANCLFSVAGGSLAILMAIEWGFKVVMITAISVYVLTAFVFITLNSRS